MKLASFSTNGRASIGAVTGKELLDLTLAWPSLMGGDASPPPTTLVNLLSRPGVLPRLSASISGASAALIRKHRIPLSDVSLHAPLAQCGKLICVASNYTAHILEAGQQ
ncbi:MAG: hypothetical protein ACRDFA_09405, partial [bacterium]